jgi:hypothetical protein
MDHSENYAAKILAEAKHIIETTGQSFGLDVADPESVGYFSNIILTFALSARDQGMEYAAKIAEEQQGRTNLDAAQAIRAAKTSTQRL